MKKTYIKPENTVVSISLETMIAGSADQQQNFSTTNAQTEGGYVVGQESREVIQTPDAWEEW